MSARVRDLELSSWCCYSSNKNKPPPTNNENIKKKNVEHLSNERFLEAKLRDFKLFKRPMTWSDLVFVNGACSFVRLLVCLLACWRAPLNIHFHQNKVHKTCCTFIYHSYGSIQRESWQIVITIILFFFIFFQIHINSTMNNKLYIV